MKDETRCTIIQVLETIEKMAMGLLAVVTMTCLVLWFNNMTIESRIFYSISFICALIFLNMDYYPPKKHKIAVVVFWTIVSLMDILNSYNSFFNTHIISDGIIYLLYPILFICLSIETFVIKYVEEEEIN